ncbi:AAA family ATPase [Deinococcus hohokamensis]|uniref:AAA family ATPase n=1 Tax=Deinococcus hohokamensis TaxID=309883 RepID=A0ABV9I979_9DEIO
MVHLVYGPQGAGKTTYARALAAQTQGVRCSMDDWMVTLFGPDLPEPPELSWVMDRVERCQTQIWSLTQQLVSINIPVILDLGLLRTEDRQRARQRAERCGAAVAFHFLDAPVALRRSRVLQRNTARGDTFSLVVSPEMFDVMETLYQAPDPAERAQARQAVFSHA